jgi:hypothetical protein
MSIGRLTGVLLLIGWLSVPLRAEAAPSVPSCSSVFNESVQEYRTVCSNGTYYTTRYRPSFRDWESHQLFPSGPRKSVPIHRQPQPRTIQR